MLNINIGLSANLIAKQGHKKDHYQFFRATNNSHFHGGRGGQGKGILNKPIYQLCGKVGHIALKCYHRFNIRFTRPQQQPQYENYALLQGTHLQDNVQAYFFMSTIINDPNQ